MLGQPERAASRTAALLAGAIAGVIAAVGVHFALKRFDGGSSQAPMIAVLDVGQVVAELPKDDTAADLVKQRMNRIREAVEKLKNSGYVVLDGQAVLGAPEGAYVPTELVR